MVGGRAAAGKIRLTERRQKALSFRRAGDSYRKIATQVAAELNIPGYCESQACRDVAAALSDLINQTRLEAEQYRELELERLNVAQLAIAHLVQGGDLQAIDRWVRISERRCRLLGLDAPIQLQVDQQLQAEMNEFLSQLEEVLPASIYRQVLEAATMIEARRKAN